MNFITGEFIAQVIIALVIMHALLGVISYLILLERKTAAWMQDRLGPNRVGPGGLLQPIADGVKFLLKEEFMPRNADKFLFFLAPVAILTPAFCGFAIIPWGGVLKAGSSVFGLWSFPNDFPFMVANPDVGALFVIAMASLGVYGVVLGGWSSGSKYSFLGGLRATAQMLSYEIPMGLALLAVAMTVASLKLNDIIADQARYGSGVLAFLPHWNFFQHPIAALVFITCIFAECNRTPFDLPECESELVGGYHTEYSSMKLALFFLAEYNSMITGSAVAVALFFGGWHLPWLDLAIYGKAQPAIGGWLDVALKLAVFSGKVLFFLFFYMWIRWTLPRFRFDQLMNVAWRGMIPLSLGSFLISAIGVYLNRTGVLTHQAYWFVGANAVLFAGTLAVLSGTTPGKGNHRVAVPNSRYNPELAKAAAKAMQSA